MSYEPYKAAGGTTLYKLKIDNAETGAIFYSYNPKFRAIFPFEVVGGLTFPAGYYCTLAVEKESRTENRNYEFPYIDGLKLNYYRDETSFQYLILTINSPLEGTIGKDLILRGVILTFENGKTIELADQKLSHSPNGAGGTAITAIIGVLGDNKEHMELLKNSKLVKIKLNKYEREFKEGLTLVEYIKCGTK